MPHPSKQQAPVSRNKLHQPVNGPEHARRHSNKKGGAGSRGTWGRVGDEFDDAPAALDEKDPNFDPEEVQERRVMACTSYSSWC